MNRQSYNMNFDWQFHYGDILVTGHECVHEERFPSPIWMKSGNCGVSKFGFDKVEWESVQLPHDFRIHRGIYNPEKIAEAAGYLEMGIAWYRKEFYIPREQEGSAIFLEFDGVYRDSEVYLNGHLVCRHLSGYTSFSYEVSDIILYDQPNVVAVRCNADNYEGWWYEAAGIYRDVRLTVCNHIHMKQDGVFARAYIEDHATEETLEKEKVNLKIDVEIENTSGTSNKIDVVIEVLDEEYICCSQKQSITIEPYTSEIIKIEDVLHHVKLWDIERCYSYTVRSSLYQENQLIDQTNTIFGVKDIQFSPDQGVILNGRTVKIQGFCAHDDFAAVGGAMTESVIRHRMHLLKEMGCNGYRCSHNPPSPYLLKACDEIGLLVMDETRLMSTADEYLTQLEDLMKRDRNHPSVFIWSIGNEEMNIHGTPTGVRIMKKMQVLAHRLDDTRPVTYANNCDWNEITRFHENNGFHIDVFGFNYYLLRQFGAYDCIHKDFPNTMILGSENGSGQSTRGQYLPRTEEHYPEVFSGRVETTMVWANEKRKYNVSAYTESYPLWGATPLETMQAADKPYVAGYFTWTAFDYRGEVFPFAWPSVLSRYGVIDYCGFMKDSGHQYRVNWTQKPSIHMMPHWNFPENYEDEVEVVITANTPEVEFVLNGISQGRQEVEPYHAAHYFVPYVPGEIIAIGYQNGIEVVRTSCQTAGKPAAVKLELLNVETATANGEDNIMVKASVVDEFGRENLTAQNKIDFTVEGVGKIAGTGNGDPLSHAHDYNTYCNLFNGLALVVLKTTFETGDICLVAKAEGLLDAVLEIPVIENNERLPLIAEVTSDMQVHYYDTKDEADGGL